MRTYLKIAVMGAPFGVALAVTYVGVVVTTGRGGSAPRAIALGFAQEGCSGC
jgi:hypothetical protein